jgi:uncharacterized protein YqgC (DUF456 family)
MTLTDLGLAIPIAMMIAALFLSLVPLVPGPALMWVVALLFGLIEGFDRLTILALVVISVLALAGSTTDFWLRPIGMKSEGVSGWVILGSFIGGLLSTFLIPVPILGSLVGAILGALLVEYLRVGNLGEAWRAAKTTLKLILVGKGVEFVFCCAILIVFILSLLTTG